MKRYLYILAASLTALLGSCEKDPVEKTDPVDNTPKDITLSAASFEAVTAGGEFSLTVTAPSRPKVTGEPDWITVKDGTYNNYKITYGLTVKENTTYEERTATLTVTAGSLSKTVSVKQAAAEKPEPPTPVTPTGIKENLVTSDATQAAKNLYGYLRSIYGQKVLSGVLAQVNWNHQEADRIHTATGKYPAVNCYDFIHIYVPQNNWINYQNLTPVTEWADAGGIVSLMWHFNVPKTATTIPGSDGSGVTCTPSETAFRAANVFTDGSWENKWFYSEMDKVVDVILKLQAKGIAAIWRPFHEGAGNACAKQQAGWTKAWFWWGYDGAETYKKLWTTMFDYFASKGVKNLIWVWTTQNFNGNSSQYNQDKDWYPGDAYVDIVGRDLYGYTAQQNATEFAEIQAAYPDRMVVLAECGVDSGNGNKPFSEVADFWNAGAKWGWFVPWYGSNMPNDTWWNNALKQSFVVTRDQVKY